MRAALLLVFALLFEGSGYAQTTTTAPAAEVVAPPCFPGINGVHIAAPRYVSGETGKHFYWFCSARGGEPKIYGFSCIHDQCAASALNAAQTAIIAATAKVGTAQAVYKASVQFDCPAVIDEDSPRGELCRERRLLLVAMIEQWLKGWQR